MGTFVLIESSSMRNLNKTEKLNLLRRFMDLLPTGTGDEGGSPEGISVLSETGVPALNITAGQVTRMNEIIDEMADLDMQSSAATETPEMQQVEADRDTTANYIINRVTDYKKLPTAAERAAGQQLEPTIKLYKGIANLPVAQETEKIDGMLIDLDKEDKAELVATLQLEGAIDELRRLNDRYKELTKSRDAARGARSQTTTNVAPLVDEAQDLLDDMCALANASSLLEPSVEATNFIAAVNTLFASVRAAYKQRSKGEKKTTDEPTEPTEPTEPGEEGGSPVGI